MIPSNEPSRGSAPFEERTLTLSPEAIDKARSGVAQSAGVEVGNYAVHDEIARGAMGSIREADDLKLQRTVAMKLMLAASRATDSMRERFAREATVLAKLAHPNIVPVHDLGQDSEGHPFYTMKLVKGRTLQAVLNDVRDNVVGTAKKYTLDRLLTIFRKVCDAMAFAHSQGIIHRDLKPENIMVGEFGEVLVMDWGLAKFLREGEDAPDGGGDDVLSVPLGDAVRSDFGRTLEGTVMGTPQYMSPEQAEGRISDMDECSDIYSLGGILYAILTLRPPVEGKTLQEVLEKVASGNIVSPSAYGASTGGGTTAAKGEVLEAKKIKPLPHCPGGRVPAALSSVVMKALALDRAKRYQNVTAFSADVEAYQTGFATSAEQAGVLKQLALLIKRHKGIFSTAAAAWIIITALTAWFVINVARAKKQAEDERNTATRERDRAENTLIELRGTAPTFVAQATALIEAGKFDDALAKLGYAIQLDSKNSTYHLHRANLLEASQRLAEAAAAYQEVLALDPANHTAKDNLALCQRLQEENGALPLRRTLQMELLDALLRQNRAVEGGPLAMQLGVGGAALEATLRARLKEYTAQPGWYNSRVLRLPNGTFRVSLFHLKLGDLSVFKGLPVSELNLTYTDLSNLQTLAGLPLTSLNIEGTQVTDLSPLRGLKLESLNCGLCRVADLEPLRGMPLHALQLNRAQVTDLSVLAGMPMEDLNLGSLKIKSLAPLCGMPLRHLFLVGATGDNDMANFVECRELEDVSMSKYAANIEALRALPKLAQLRLEDHQDAVVPAETFWAAFRPEMEAMGKILLALKRAGISLGSHGYVNRMPDGSVDVGLGDTAVTDLGFLHGLLVSRLNIYNTKVHDLTPLRGLPLEVLGVSNTPVIDLEPLRGLPLTVLNLHHTPVTSVAPLLDCPSLETICVPLKASDLETLRKVPKLRLLSYEWDYVTNLPDKTAEQFWKEYDAQKATSSVK